MSVTLTPNWPIIAEPTTGTDLVPYNWFTAGNWSYNPAEFISVNFGIYGGVQFTGVADVGTNTVVLDLGISGCDVYAVQLLLMGAYMSNAPVIVNGQSCIGEGWHTILSTTPVITFELAQIEAIFQVLNVVVTCPEIDEKANCKGGDFKQPIYAECSELTVAEQMQAIRDQWIADGTTTYEAPQCVEPVLQALFDIETSDCEWTAEDMVISHPATLGSSVVTNGNFASGTTGWTGISGRASVTGAKLVYVAGAGGTVSQNCLTIGKWYQLTIIVSNYTAGLFEIEFGSSNSVGTIDTNGTFTFTGQATGITFAIVPDASFAGRIDNILVQEFLPVNIVGVWDGLVVTPTFTFTTYQNGAVLRRFAFSDTGILPKRGCFRLLMAMPYNSSTSQTPPNEYALSNNFELIPDKTHTLQFQALMENDGSAYGWEQPNGAIYAPRMRLFSELSQPRYSGELDQYQDSAGTRNVIYAESRKAQQLKITWSPEYVHDFLRIACRTDLFGIRDANDVNKNYFTNSEEYQPAWIRISKLAPVMLEVEERTQDVTKNLCN